MSNEKSESLLRQAEALFVRSRASEIAGNIASIAEGSLRETHIQIVGNKRGTHDLSSMQPAPIQGLFHRHFMNFLYLFQADLEKLAKGEGA